MHTPFFHLCSSAQCVQSQGLPKFNLHLWKKFPLLVLNASPFNFMEDAQVLVLWDSPGVADLPPVGYSLSYMLLLCLLLFIAYLRFKKSLSISCHVRDFSISLIILDGLLWITSNYAILFLKSVVIPYTVAENAWFTCATHNFSILFSIPFALLTVILQPYTFPHCILVTPRLNVSTATAALCLLPASFSPGHFLLDCWGLFTSLQ